MARGRKRLVLGWGLAGLTLTVGLVWAASAWWSLRLRMGAWSLNARCGTASLWEGSGSPHLSVPAFSVEVHRPVALDWTLLPDWLTNPSAPGTWDLGVARRSQWGVGTGLLAPPYTTVLLLWPVVAALALPAAAALLSGRRAARRSRVDLCPTCGYDRSTLPPTTPCPECGAPTPTPPPPPPAGEVAEALVGGARPEGEVGPHTGRRSLSTPPPNPPHPLRRLATRLALHTAAGLAATLALAWGPALRYDESGDGHLERWSLGEGHYGSALIHHSVGADFIEIIGMERPSIPPRFEDEFPRFFDRGNPIFAIGSSTREAGDKARELRGLPWRCFSADYEVDPVGGKPAVTGGLRLADGIRGISAENYGRVLPLTPRWGGLLLDVALFATASFAFSTAFVTLRQRRRRLRGLCLACGYPRPGLAGPCPECGNVPAAPPPA